MLSKSSGQPSSSIIPLNVSGWFGHKSKLSGYPSPSVSDVDSIISNKSGQPSSSWNLLYVSGLNGHDHLSKIPSPSASPNIISSKTSGQPSVSSNLL